MKGCFSGVPALRAIAKVDTPGYNENFVIDLTKNIDWSRTNVDRLYAPALIDRDALQGQRESFQGEHRLFLIAEVKRGGLSSTHGKRWRFRLNNGPSNSGSLH